MKNSIFFYMQHTFIFPTYHIQTFHDIPKIITMERSYEPILDTESDENVNENLKKHITASFVITQNLNQHDYHTERSYKRGSFFFQNIDEKQTVS